MIGLISLLLTIYSLILLARVFMTWMPNLDPRNPVAKFLFDVTEPVLAPVRSVLPPMQGIDFSPIVVFVIINIIQRLLL